ncbi:MAG TPA: hypothetical protein VLI06_21940 [Solimonas sp.]|nr:hypothetical protein [Solimonas sp.]
MGDSGSSRLMAAGTALAGKFQLDQLTPALIADHTGLTREQFQSQFGAVDVYLEQVHHQFMERLLQALVAAAGSLPPGLERMSCATDTQLDYCLQHLTLRGLLADARRRVPRVAASFHKRTQTTALMIGIELKSLGCANPQVIARLYCVMTLEAAQVEADAGAPVPAARAALADFLRNAMAA